MSLKPGERITPYEIVGLLGAGGMGEVYRARDARLGRDVAIKVLPAAFAGDPERLGRFELEARAAAALNHPNILAVYDIGQYSSPGSGHAYPYIVTELLEGDTLRERLEGGALPVRKAVEYAVQVAKGLAAAHDKGIVHRDLKPENIFVTADGRVKILDFGLAKLTQPEPAFAATALHTAPPNTQAGMVLGTIGYMAPEQVRGLAADHRADIFAFGAILYELLSGHRAFRGETPMDTMTAILKEDPPALPATERHVPPALERIVARCLEKAPAARFKSADDLAFALESLSTRSEALPLVTGRVKVARREQAAWLAAAVGLVAALAIAVAYVTRAAGPTAAPEMRLQIVTPPNASPISFALSPDGATLAFLAGGQLWLRPLASETARAIPGTEGAASGGSQTPFWSPDSRSLGFFTTNQLKRIDIDTGLVQALADTSIAIGGTWGSEGIILFAPSPSSPIMRIGAGGRELAEATHLDAPRQVGHRFPQFLPDGRRFLFLVQGTSESRGVYVGSLDSAETRRLLDGDTPAVFAPPSSLLFMRQEALLAQPLNLETGDLAGDPVPLAARVTIAPGGFNALAASASMAGPIAYRAHTGAVQLFWADRAGRQIGLVGQPDAGQPGQSSLSPDGRTLALTRTVNGNTDVWLMDLERNVVRPFTFETTRDVNATWSPDGRRIVFQSERAGVYDIYEKPADGTGTETLLLASPQAKIINDWSPDGRFILYQVQDPTTQNDVWVLPLTGDRKPFVVAQTQFAETGARFSPDGHWIAYVSNETGRSEVFVQPFPGPGGKIQISAGGGTVPQWRRDGREIYYLGPNNRVMAVPIAVTGTTLQAATPVPLFTAPTAAMVASLDGQRFLVSTVTEEDAPITLLLNWAGLRR